MKRKKIFFVLLLASLLSFNLYPLEITLGVNYHTVIMKNLEKYIPKDSGEVPEVTANIGDDVDFGQGHITGYAGIFADFTYVVLGTGLQFQTPGTWWAEMDINGLSDTDQSLDFQYDNDISFLYLDNYLYIKYPFHLGKVVYIPHGRDSLFL